MSDLSVQYQHITVSGTSWERGHSHGVQAYQKIRTNINRYAISTSLPPKEDCLHYIKESYLPAIEKLFPDGLEEMKGIASGAEVDLEDIILLNARYDLARLTGHKVGECTSMAYLGPNGSAIVAQNWDMSAWLHDLDTIIILESHLPPSQKDNPTTPTAPKRIIALTEAGQLARSGMNSRGLGLCANSLWTTEDKPPSKPCLPFTLARTMYLHCPNFAAGLKALCTFPRHVSGNLMVASKDLAMDIELTASNKFLLQPTPMNAGIDIESQIITHANHYTHPGMYHPDISVTHDTYPGGSSLFRHTRLEQRLKMIFQKASNRSIASQIQRQEVSTAKRVSPPTPPADDNTKIPKDLMNIHPLEKSQLESGFLEATSQSPILTVQDLKQAFSDHASFPRSLCEHAEKGTERYGAATSGDKTMTVACVIYDLNRGEMHVSRGNPCQGEKFWTKISLEMEEIII